VSEQEAQLGAALTQLVAALERVRLVASNLEIVTSLSKR